MKIKAGTQVGLYHIIEQLGQGGMATVFKAHHTVLKRDAALKFLHPAFLEDPEFARRFQHEASIIASLEHPNIVPVFDFAEYDGLPYLAMKFVRGVTLKAKLSVGPVSRKEAIRIMSAVGNGLAYAHEKGILHRDVKPSNILLGEDGGIFLADFGIARIAASAQSTLSSEMLIGTPQYISPEQARSEPDLDERTDIYSLGIVLYELLVGNVPFDADTPFSVIHDHLYTPPPTPSMEGTDISEDVDRIILKALAKKREERFASVESMLDAFFDAVDAPEKARRWLDNRLHAQQRGDVKRAAPTVPAPDKRESIPDPIQAKLATVAGLNFPLQGIRLLIGRGDPTRGISPDIDLTDAEPEDPESGRRRRTVHREQAWITWSDGCWWLEAMPGKEDRARLNGEPMRAGRRYKLEAGDRMQFGAVELEFRAGPSAD